MSMLHRFTNAGIFTAPLLPPASSSPCGHNSLSLHQCPVLAVKCCLRRRVVRPLPPVAALPETHLTSVNLYVSRTQTAVRWQPSLVSAASDIRSPTVDDAFGGRHSVAAPARRRWRGAIRQSFGPHRCRTPARQCLSAATASRSTSSTIPGFAIYS